MATKTRPTVSVDFKYDLGDEVKDILTGFSGVVTGQAKWITGCSQYTVAPKKLDKEGKLIASEWFDENRLELVKGKVVTFGNAGEGEPSKNGGPQKIPALRRG